LEFILESVWAKCKASSSFLGGKTRDVGGNKGNVNGQSLWEKRKRRNTRPGKKGRV